MRILIPLFLLLPLPALAADFTPPPNFSVEYRAASSELQERFKVDSKLYTAGVTWYFTNNISSKITIGGSKGDQAIFTTAGVTNHSLRIKYFASIDLRYEVPFSRSLSTYALFGGAVMSYNSDSSQFNLGAETGLKAGIGISYALSKNTALYFEVAQDLYNSDHQTQSIAAGFKFTY